MATGQFYITKSEIFLQQLPLMFLTKTEIIKNFNLTLRAETLPLSKLL